MTDNPVMQSLNITPIHLTRVDPELNMARFYGVTVQPTLFGEISILRSWGRIGTKGQGLMVTYEDASQAIVALRKLEQQKRRRGYIKVVE